VIKPSEGKPWSKQAPAGPWDYLIVGSGMGGMTTAALLAKLGRRVLVLEQHYVPGGFTHSFTRPGYRWDVGVHAVGEVTAHSMPGRVLEWLTDGRLEWASLGPTYDEFHFPGGFRIDFPDNPQTFRHNLLEAFPADAGAVDGYFRRVRQVARAMRGYYMARALPPTLAPLADPLLGRRAQHELETTTGQVLDALTANDELKTVLTAQWGYYGATPTRSSFAIQALVAKHFLYGGFYPVGGSQQIARCLLQPVTDAGGFTRIGADVEQILVEGGRAVGVRLAGGETIRAKRVVSAVGVAATVRRLLPEAHRSAEWARDVGALTPAPAHVCLYLGFKGDIRQAGAGTANKWFYSTWNHEQASWPVSPDAEPDKPPVLYCSFPSLKDPQHEPGPEERHTGEVVTFVPWQPFVRWQAAPWHKRGQQYEAFKKRIADHMLAGLLEQMPGLEPMVDFAELSTPVSTDHFCRPIEGSIYGLAATPTRFQNRWLRPRSPIRGLFLSGSEVATCGVIGAMMGGLLAAVSAEPVGAMRHLRDVI